MCRYQAGMVEHALNSIITTLQFQINKLFYLYSDLDNKLHC